MTDIVAKEVFVHRGCKRGGGSGHVSPRKNPFCNSRIQKQFHISRKVDYGHGTVATFWSSHLSD